MSTLFTDGNGRVVPVFAHSQEADVVTAYTGTPGLTAAFAKKVVARFVATTDCHILFGTAPTADANDTFLPASTVEYFVINKNDKVSVIQNAAGGNLHISIMG